MKGRRRKLCSTMLFPDTLEQVKARALAESVTVSRIVEWAVLDFLKNTRPRDRKSPAPLVVRAAPEAPPVPPMAEPFGKQPASPGETNDGKKNEAAA